MNLALMGKAWAQAFPGRCIPEPSAPIITPCQDGPAVGAKCARHDRAGMLETMSEDYIRAARAKGLPERTVIFTHGLRAALTPLVTIFGLDLGLLLGGAILTETTFSFPGLGQFTIEAIQNQDLPEIQGVVMLAAFFIVIANMIVDILYAVVDPRVRF